MISDSTIANTSFLPMNNSVGLVLIIFSTKLESSYLDNESLGKSRINKLSFFVTINVPFFRDWT